MRIKSFFANTIDAAMKAAHQEMGPEALVVTSRKSPTQAQHLGMYEVVAGVIDESTEAAATEGGAGSGSSQPREEGKRAVPLTSQLTELRRQIEGLRDYLGRSELPPLATLNAWPEEAEACLADLVQQEMDPEVARSVIESAVPQMTLVGSLRKHVAAELKQRIQVSEVIAQDGKEPRMVALVGPPGCGKTTVLVKLAIRYGLLERRPVHLVCTDSVRVGAVGQLRTFAALLGIRYRHLENPAAVVAGLSRFSPQDLVLIDTPGFSAGAFDMAGDLAEALAGQPGLRTSLVLPASMRRADMRAIVKRYELFRPDNWIVTKVDETSAYGCFLSESMRLRRPISYLGTGQQIPEDLEVATKERLTSLVVDVKARPVASVA